MMDDVKLVLTEREADALERLLEWASGPQLQVNCDKDTLRGVNHKLYGAVWESRE